MRDWKERTIGFYSASAFFWGIDAPNVFLLLSSPPELWRIIAIPVLLICSIVFVYMGMKGLPQYVKRKKKALVMFGGLNFCLGITFIISFTEALSAKAGWWPITLICIGVVTIWALSYDMFCNLVLQPEPEQTQQEEPMIQNQRYPRD